MNQAEVKLPTCEKVDCKKVYKHSQYTVYVQPEKERERLVNGCRCHIGSHLQCRLTSSITLPLSLPLLLLAAGYILLFYKMGAEANACPSSSQLCRLDDSASAFVLVHDWAMAFLFLLFFNWSCSLSTWFTFFAHYPNGECYPSKELLSWKESYSRKIWRTYHSYKWFFEKSPTRLLTRKDLGMVRKLIFLFLPNSTNSAAVDWLMNCRCPMFIWRPRLRETLLFFGILHTPFVYWSVIGPFSLQVFSKWKESHNG